MLSGLSDSFLNQLSFVLAFFSGGLFPLGGAWPPALLLKVSKREISKCLYQTELLFGDLKD